MPSTYTLISSNVLTSSAASVTFSAIPSTYTDLVLRVSLRSTANTLNCAIIFNSNTSSIHSGTFVYGFSTTAGSGNELNTSALNPQFTNSNAMTANTFGSAELYIPNYTNSSNKPVSSINASETNSATDAWIMGYAGLWRGSAAITSITITSGSGGSHVSGSSFYLYGIKNS